MARLNKGILILCPFFSPNIGGVETHLDDLVTKLDQLKYNVFVQSHSPITTPNVAWLKNEKRGQNINISSVPKSYTHSYTTGTLSMATKSARLGAKKAVIPASCSSCQLIAGRAPLKTKDFKFIDSCQRYAGMTE